MTRNMKTLFGFIVGLALYAGEFALVLTTLRWIYGGEFSVVDRGTVAFLMLIFTVFTTMFLEIHEINGQGFRRDIRDLLIELIEGEEE